MADDFGGDALPHLAFGLGIDRQREIGVGLDVDEARRDGEAGGVDGFLCRAADAANRGDTAVLDRQIADDARTAAAVVDRPAADQYVVGHTLSLSLTPRREHSERT